MAMETSSKPAAGRDWRTALALAEAKCDVFAFSASISACGKASQWPRAVALLRGMPQARVAPNAVSYGAAINALKRGGHWADALGLLEEMQSSQVQLSLICCNAALSALGACAETRSALKLLADMGQLQVEADVVSCSACISACEKQWQAALEVLATCRRSMQPDVICINAAISAAASAFAWPSALHLLGEMSTFALAPVANSFNAAVSACGQGSQWQRALHLLEEMPSRDLTPDAFTFAAAITACGGSHWELALGLLHRATRARRCDAVACAAGQSACSAAGRWRWSLQILEPSFQILPCSPNRRTS
ncbi:unnamed protein product [Effrenium voratum]|nr:unnamed protein product [Effrenium voratum]